MHRKNDEIIMESQDEEAEDDFFGDGNVRYNEEETKNTEPELNIE